MKEIITKALRQVKNKYKLAKFHLDQLTVLKDEYFEEPAEGDPAELLHDKRQAVKYVRSILRDDEFSKALFGVNWKKKKAVLQSNQWLKNLKTINNKTINSAQ